jgi:hypothetical protein
MRKTIALASLALGVAATFLPVAPASAYCNAALYALTGQCTNECKIAGNAYYTADRTAGDALPDVEWICFQ